MRKLSLLGVAILCVAGTVGAQTISTVSTTSADGGAPQMGRGADLSFPWQLGMNFSYQRFDIGHNNNNLYGIQTNVVRYVGDSMFGIEGDVAATFGRLNPHDREQVALYGGGLHVGKRSGKIQPWGHIIAGGAHDRFNQGIGPASYNGFGLLGGGGVDFLLMSHISLRVEADYMGTHFGGVWQKSINTGGGLVINF